MTIYSDYSPILRKQIWEDYEDYKAELEDDIMLEQLNKLYNRRGYLLNDYQNEDDY